ncbi:MAG: hypothetical protein IIB40_12475 [Candidatus Marinimicrobia bacterium]|nr:hypothetical protein [Candidatus Neomarinimicrobiota bacterium]
MSLRDSKVMFQIYRETKYHGDYRAVFFSELNDYNKDTEINKALAGEHFISGYILELRRDKAQKIIDNILDSLNNGTELAPEAALKELEPVLA